MPPGPVRKELISISGGIEVGLPVRIGEEDVESLLIINRQETLFSKGRNNAPK